MANAIKKTLQYLIFLTVSFLLTSCSQDVDKNTAGTKPPTGYAATPKKFDVVETRQRKSANLKDDRIQLFNERPNDIIPIEVFSPMAFKGVPEDVAQIDHSEKDTLLRNQNAITIWRMWDEAISRENPDEIALTAVALGDLLRRQGDFAIYQEIEQRLYDSMSSMDDRLALIDILKFAATKEALNILLEHLAKNNPSINADLYGESMPEELKSKLREAIGVTARVPIDGNPNWAASQPLESTWRALSDSSSNEDLSVIAESLAFLGTKSAIKELLQTAIEQQDIEPQKVTAALKALTQVMNVDAVPVLQEGLFFTSIGSDAEDAILQALVSIGKADAGFALVDYLKGSTGMTDTHMEYVKQTLLNVSYPEETQKVFNEALSEYEITDPRSIDILVMATSSGIEE